MLMTGLPTGAAFRHVTDARTARRLLPVAGVGGGIAWTISGLAVTPLVAAIGSEGLLLAGAVLLVVTLGLTLAIERSDLDREARGGAGRRESSVRDALRFVARVPLLRMMATLFSARASDWSASLSKTARPFSASAMPFGSPRRCMIVKLSAKNC